MTPRNSTRLARSGAWRHTDQPGLLSPACRDRRAPAPRRRLEPAILGCCVALVASLTWGTPAQAAGQAGSDAPAARSTFADAQNHFYNARYQASADLALELRGSDAADLPSAELRSSALLFQLKGLLEKPADKHTDRADKADTLKACQTCPALMTAFFEDVKHGQAVARAMLKENPKDEVALFYLGKLNLNYVWLQLGPLGRKTGWDEYWEARKSLDAVIKAHPQHVRALVARAWIDYIVDTRMPWGTGWVLGGGSKKRALKAVREAVAIPADFYTHTEAEFALWDMRVRERDVAEATAVARRLARDFPDNREVAKYLEVSESARRR
jgi:hypothetical protein